MAEDLASERYRLLVEQLVAEEGGRRGAKAEVARRLGVTSPYISMVLSGRRGAAKEAIDKAMGALGIRSAFFFDEAIGKTPDYREFMTEDKVQLLGVEPAPYWDEFVESYPYIAEISESDLSAMRNFAARTHRIRSWHDWAELANWVRNRKPSATYERKVREYEERLDSDREKYLIRQSQGNIIRILRESIALNEEKLRQLQSSGGNPERIEELRAELSRLRKRVEAMTARG